MCDSSLCFCFSEVRMIDMDYISVDIDRVISLFCWEHSYAVV